MSTIKQIAALPWRRDAHGRLEILLVTSRTSRRWILPKGWPISGMSGAEVAHTEAVEEAGVDGIVAAVPVGSYEYVKDRGQRSARRGHAEVYALEVTDERQVWKEMHQRERRWVSATEGAVLVCEIDLSRLLSDISLMCVVRGP